MALQKRPNWWPALIIVVITAIIQIYFWSSSELDRQFQVLGSGISIIAGLLGLLIWFLFFSRIPNWTRIKTMGAIALLVIVFFSIFRVKGVSGDFVPIFEARWSEGIGALSDGSLTGEEIWYSPNDYPQYLGPRRNARLNNISLVTNLASAPPQQLWRQPIGEAWSGFSVVGDAAITQEQRGPLEMVVCYDLKSGAVKWSHADSARYSVVVAGTGPRSTPTIHKNRVYTMGATGILNALDLQSGQKIWGKNVLSEHNAGNRKWGFSCSPLIMDSMVIVTPGGAGSAVVAYHIKDGSLLWQSGGAKPGYSSPAIAVLDGVLQIVVFLEKQVAGYAPADGRQLWKYDWPGVNEATSQPLPIGPDRLFISTGYGIGALLLEFTQSGGQFQVKKIWQTPRMKAKLTNVVYEDGFIYGLDDGVLACIDIKTGQRKWKRGRYGHGQLIKIGNTLLIQAEHGFIAFVEVNSEKYNEIGRFEALDGKTWNTPAFANPYLLVRNDQEAACYKLAVE